MPHNWTMKLVSSQLLVSYSQRLETMPNAILLQRVDLRTKEQLAERFDLILCHLCFLSAIFSFTTDPSFISLEPKLVAESEISERESVYFLHAFNSAPNASNGSRITPSESKPHLSDLNKHPNAFLICFRFAELMRPPSKSPCVNIKCFNRILWDNS